jgi:hypothetical protein
MRCFFHLVNGAETIVDDVGIEVANLEAAKIHAWEAIGELRREADDVAQGWGGWQLNIVCSEGIILYSIPLTASLH